MSILIDAENIIHGERKQEYGPARESFDSIGKVWSGILKIDVTGEQVALCMAGLKLVREANQHKLDNLVDGAGYLALIEVMQKEKELQTHNWRECLCQNCQKVRRANREAGNV